MGWGRCVLQRLSGRHEFDRYGVPFLKAGTIDGVIEYLMANYRVQMDHALLLGRLYQKGVSIVAYCPGVAADIISAMRMTPVDNVELAFDIASAKYLKQGI